MNEVERCWICGLPIKLGTGNWHHKYHPKKSKWVRALPTYLRREKHRTHIDCQDDYHEFYKSHCQSKRGRCMCLGCKFAHICCYVG